MPTPTNDPSAPFYQQNVHESDRDRKMFETIGRIIVAWGSADSVISKLWWHYAVRKGDTLTRDVVYRSPMPTKLAEIRKLLPSDGGRTDLQFEKLSAAAADIGADRHALAHGYLAMSAKGPVAINLRNDHHTCAIDLDGMFRWCVYIADVAHQMYSEATVGIYDADGPIFCPDPVPPKPYVRTAVPGLSAET